MFKKAVLIKFLVILVSYVTDYKQYFLLKRSGTIFIKTVLVINAKNVPTDIIAGLNNTNICITDLENLQ